MNFIKKYWALIVLAGITLFGFLLRLHNLDWQCLKVDELVTISVAKSTSFEIARWALSVDYNPPGYYLLAHWSSMLFGEITRFTIRFPALIFGTLAIPATYLIGKELKGTTLGLLGAAIVSFTFPFFYYSQDARAYPLVLFCFLMFTYFYVKAYHGDESLKTLAFAAFFASACLYSHYYSLVPMVIMGLFLLKKNHLSATTIVAGSLFLLTPMILMFDFAQFSTRTNHSLFNVLWISPAMMSTLLLNEMFCWAWVVIVPLALYTVAKFDKSDLNKIFLLAAAVTAVLCIPLAQITAIMPRYAVLVAPLVILVSLIPISDLIDKQENFERKVAIFGVCCFVLFLFSFQSIMMWYTFDTCPFVDGVR